MATTALVFGLDEARTAFPFLDDGSNCFRVDGGMIDWGD
jgi:hypothetical protein